MDFNVDQTVFPSTVHNLIYSTARGIIPLETSLSVITDGEMRSSCTAYHGFIMAMLSDMYDNPNEYHLPVMLLEDYCKGTKNQWIETKISVENEGNYCTNSECNQKLYNVYAPTWYSWQNGRR